MSYKDKDNTQALSGDKELIQKFNAIGDDMLKQICNVTLPSEYYIKNHKHYKIRAILDAYNFINEEISKVLENESSFNPSMLYFSLLALWFKELNKESKSKEYIYFIIYPYSNVYDEFLVGIKNQEFKKLNIKMIELAEKVIYKLDSYSFK